MPIFSDSDRGGKFEILSELASKERLFYYQLALIWQAVLTPLLQSGKYNNNTLQRHAKKYSVQMTLELVNFAIRLLISVLKLHDGQVTFFGGIKITIELQ